MVWGHAYEYGFMYLRRVYTRGVNHRMRPGQSGGMHACMCLSRVNHVRICMRRCTWLHESDQLCVYVCTHAGIRIYSHAYMHKQSHPPASPSPTARASSSPCPVRPCVSALTDSSTLAGRDKDKVEFFLSRAIEAPSSAS